MDHSPLSRLSGELRNIIYAYLWPEQGEVIICLCGTHHPLRSHMRNPKIDEAWTYAGSLLPKVCRQLRYEALSYFYSVNSFVLPMQYVFQAGDDQAKLEAQWTRFVQVFGVDVVRQIKHMTVLAGKLGRVSVVKTPGRKATAEQTAVSGRLHIVSGVDVPCIFARKSIQPCLNPAARMLVLVEHHITTWRRAWIDFDDKEATLDGIVKAAEAEDPHCKADWTTFCGHLLLQWFHDVPHHHLDDKLCDGCRDYYPVHTDCDKSTQSLRLSSLAR